MTATIKVLASTSVTGQYEVKLLEKKDSYRVEYGAEASEFMSLKQALNNYNQCVLHAETCAGFHG